MRSKRLLRERIADRIFSNGGAEKLKHRFHVRTELDRLARQIRKMDVVRQEDVLRLIREAKK